jgi:hypothetical protein
MLNKQCWTPTLDCELQRATHSTNEVSASLLPGIIKQRTNTNFTVISKCGNESFAMWYPEYWGSSSSAMLAIVWYPEHGDSSSSAMLAIVWYPEHGDSSSSAMLASVWYPEHGDSSSSAMLATVCQTNCTTPHLRTPEPSTLSWMQVSPDKDSVPLDRRLWKAEGQNVTPPPPPKKKKKQT